MKEAGTLNWYSPNTGATNESGFTGLPAGSRRGTSPFDEGIFFNFGYIGTWWTSSPQDLNTNVKYEFVGYKEVGIFNAMIRGSYGFSVRCVRD